MLINQLAVSEEERNVTRARMKSLLRSYHRGKIGREEIDRYYTEWVEIATRLNKGAEMLDNGKAVQERSKQHMKELEDLYTLLLKMVGIYDMFFKRMFEEHPDRHVRAQSKIMDILNGKAA